MHEILLMVTAAALCAGVTISYSRTRDVLHPVMFLGPLLFYGTVLDPWLVRRDWERFIPSPEDLTFVLLLNGLAVMALLAGATARNRMESKPRPREALDRRRREVLRHVALLLAAWAAFVYVWGIANAGGFEAAFSRVKGGGQFQSGYLGEAMNLSLVAAVMAALSRYRSGWTPSTLAVCAIGLLPNLIQGSFGGRRGPLFLALSAALLAWVVVRRRTARLRTVWPSLAVAGLAVAFVGSQRQFVYMGSEENVSWEEFERYVTQSDVDQGNNFIYGAGFVLATRQAGEFTWGRELAVNLLVRPIPRQLWPTKYEDAGATWVTSNYPGLGHVTEADWLAAVGWLPLAGSSAISISDLYGEFGWGAVVVFYLIGRGFAALYWRRRAWGGVWELLYLEALILSIYLATQSFSAFYHRYLVLVVPTVIAWKLFIEHRGTRSARGAAVVYRKRSALPRPAR